jgi:peptidoglycan/xylan/chitin deacetylase (PgdA/CDA1 family)
MSIFKDVFLSTATVFPIAWLNRVSSIEVLLPYHHVVSDEYLPHIKGLYNYKNEQQFSDDLDWLLRYRTPVHPDELLNCIVEKKPVPVNTFLLTFDDGFREVYEVIAPILLKKGVPAIFFINPAFIDNNELFYRCKLSLVIEKIKEQKNRKLLSKVVELLSPGRSDFEQIKKAILDIHYPEREKADALGECAEISFPDFLHSQKPFMSTSQLKELSGKGFVIGAHSMDHPHFKKLTEEDQLSQTTSSMKAVNQITGSESSYFSFPHEDKDVKQSFFNHLLSDPSFSKSLLFGVQNQFEEKNNNMVHRYNAENPSRSVENITKGVLFYNYLMKVMKRNVISRD